MCSRGFPWNVLGYALTYPLPLMQSAAVRRHLRADAVRRPHLRPAAGAVERGAAPASAGDGCGRSALAVAAACRSLVHGRRSARRAWRSARGRSCRASRSASCSRACRSGRSGAPRTRSASSSITSTCRPPAPPARRDNLAGITHVVWPEAAMPFLPLDHPDARAAIGRLLPAGTFLITGALRAEPRRPARRGRGASSTACWCSARAARCARSTTRSTWCRSANTCRCSALLEAIGLQQLTRLRGGFDVGATPRPLLHVPRLPPPAPLICYEAIFPARHRAGRRAARAAAQRHQRRLVRQYHRPAPAPASGARAGGGGGHAARACRQQRHFRGHRRLRPRPGAARPRTCAA